MTVKGGRAVIDLLERTVKEHGLGVEGLEFRAAGCYAIQNSIAALLLLPLATVCAHPRCHILVRRVDPCVSVRVSMRIGEYHIRITVVSVVCHR